MATLLSVLARVRTGIRTDLSQIQEGKKSIARPKSASINITPSLYPRVPSLWWETPPRRPPACLPPDAPLFTNHCQLLGRGRGRKPSPTAGPLSPVSVLATGPSDAMSCWPGRSHHLPRNASPHPQIPKVPKSEDPTETVSSGNAPTPKDAGGRGGLCPLSLPWPQGPRGPRPTSSHWP